MFRSLVLVVALLSGGAAQAQQFMGEYFTLIGPEDFYNSSGARLTDIADIVQQDRANFHRFGIRHQFDQTDPFFGSRELRARIPSLYYSGPGTAAYIVAGLRAGNTHFIHVRIFGQNGVPQYIVVGEGAG
ncbi:MAG: hypothetical protein AAFQ66_10715 [Pseudomonadota bacterium]